MMKWFGPLLVIALLGCSQPPQDPEARIQNLGKQLRCPVCRGVPIADSPADLSKQMMEIVRQQVQEGKTDEEILKYFEERYGEWVLLAPKTQGINLAIWILPALFIIGGAVFILYRTHRRGDQQPG